MIIEAFILSVLVGFARRGSLRNLGQIPVRHLYLFVLSLVVFVGMYALAGTSGGGASMQYVRAANIIQYAILLAAIGLNRHIRGMWLVGAGTFLNFLAVAANGGVMPTSATALRTVGMTEMLSPDRTAQFVRHVIMAPEARLKLISNLIPVPGLGFVLPQVVSIGDIVIAVALFVIIQLYMCGPATDVREQAARE